VSDLGDIRESESDLQDNLEPGADGHDDVGDANLDHPSNGKMNGSATRPGRQRSMDSNLDGTLDDGKVAAAQNHRSGSSDILLSTPTRRRPAAVNAANRSPVSAFVVVCLCVHGCTVSVMLQSGVKCGLLSTRICVC